MNPNLDLISWSLLLKRTNKPNMKGCTQSSSVVTTARTSFIWCLLAIFSGLTFQGYLKPSNSAFSFPWSRPRPDNTVQCAIANYTARIIMHDPFMMHIENFISADERAYLLSLRYDFGLLLAYLAYGVIAKSFFIHRRSASKTARQPWIVLEIAAAHSFHGLILLPNVLCIEQLSCRAS